MQQTQTCRQQLTQDSYQFCPSAQLGREAAGWLMWASFWTEPCCRSGKARPGFRCFKYLVCHPALLSLSKSAAFSGSLGCHHSPFILQMCSSPSGYKGTETPGAVAGSFSSWKWRRHREWDWHRNVLEAFADIHAHVPQKSMKNNLL